LDIVISIPKPLNQQLAEERAKHPTPRDAARAGLAFALGIVGPMLAIDLITGSVSAIFAPFHRFALFGVALGGVLGLSAAIVLSIVFAQLGAAIIRWRRRLHLAVWYRDRAA
jgi:hypothetical protein